MCEKKIIFSIALRRYLYKLWKKFIKTLDNKHKIYFSFDIDQKKKKKQIFARILKISNKKINKVEMDHCRVTHGKY